MGFRVPEPGPWHWLAAALVMLGLLGAGLGHPIQDDNEGLYARVAAEMLETHEWIVPHLDGVAYLEKPPLLYWMTALSFAAFGQAEAAARAAPVLGAVLTLWAVGFLALRRCGGAVALRAVAVGASFPLFILMGRLLMFDLLFTAFLAWALVALFEAFHGPRPRAWIRIAYAMLALAVMTKGFAAVVIFAFVAIAMPSRPRLRLLRDPIALAIFLGIAAPWHVLAALREPAFAWFYFVNEHVLRFLGLREPKDYYGGSWWYYLPRVAGSTLPWLAVFLLPRARPAKDPALTRFLWAWVLVPLVFFSASMAKANYYMVLVLPPLSLLLARRLCALGPSRWSAAVPACWLALVAIGVAFAARLPGPYHWPSGAAVLAMAMAVLALASMALMVTRRPAAGAIACAACGVPLALLCSQALIANEAHDSARLAARRIAATGFEQVYLFRDFESVSSLGFYLRKPVAIIDSRSNDLRFGIALKRDAARFPTQAEFAALAHPGRVAIVVAEPQRAAFEAWVRDRGLQAIGQFGRLHVYADPSTALPAGVRTACAACGTRTH